MSLHPHHSVKILSFLILSALFITTTLTQAQTRFQENNFVKHSIRNF